MVRMVHIVAALTLAAGLLAATPAAAAPDWNRLDDPMVGGIGLHVGKIGGTGLALKYPLKWYLQLQVAGGIWRQGDTRWHNLGFEVHYILRQDDRLRLFLLGGAGYWHDEDRKEDNAGQEFWDESSNWNLGFGVGAERLIGERWAVKADVDFTFQGDDDSITLWPQAGVLFYW
jgi:hypothetical protein